MALAVAVAAAVTGCTDGSSSGFAPAYFRLANFSPGPPSQAIDFCYGLTSQAEFLGPVLEAIRQPTGAPETGIAYGEVSRYFFVYAGLYFIRIVPFGAGSCATPLVPDSLVLLDPNDLGTLALAGGSLTVDGLQLGGFLDEWTRDPATLRLRFVNASSGTTPVDAGFGTPQDLAIVATHLDWMTPSGATAAPPVDALGYATVDPALPAARPVVTTCPAAGSADACMSYALQGAATSMVTAGTIASGYFLGIPGDPLYPPVLLLCADSRGPVPGTNRSDCVLLP